MEARSKADKAGFPFGDLPFGGSEACMLCPLCLAYGALKDSQPEVMEHLMKAGMELALAFKAVVDAATERMGSRPDAEAGLQRIDIS